MISLLAASLLCIIVTGCVAGGEEKADMSVSPTPEAEQISSDQETPAIQGFQIDGSRLLDANGNEFVIRGINHPHAWYKDKAAVSFQAIAESGSNCIRLVCGSGLQFGKTGADELRGLIERAKDNHMIAVLEVHDGTGSDEIEVIQQITDYWIEVKDALEGTEAYCILNIANEWVGSWNGSLWRDGYVEAISRLREAGIKNTIMVDAAGWGQYGQSIADYGREVFDSDPDKNTMFAIHMYGTAGKNRQTIESNIKAATEQGLCICVGEFGYTHSDGDVDEEYLMQYCTENEIGYLGWSWKGNSGGVEYLDIALEWDGSVLSEDWGEVLINGEYGIKNTSAVCSVFE